MTTFSDQVYQNGGLPVGASGVPTTYGKYIFVDPDSTGADNGKTLKNAFRTVEQAYTYATTNKHDVILMNAVSAHSTASTNKELTVAKNRLHFVGLGGGSRYLGQRTRWTMGVTTVAGTIAVVQNTGVGNTFTNIKFDSADTLSTSVYAFADGGEYTQLTNCEVVKSTDLDQANAAPLLANGDTSYYKNCAFGSLVYIVSAARSNVMFDRETITGKVARDVTFEDCIFLLKTSSTGASQLEMTGATDIERFLLLKNCTFINAVLGAADPAVAIKAGAALTEGYVLVQGGGEVGHTALATQTGIFTSAPIANAGGVSALQTT